MSKIIEKIEDEYSSFGTSQKHLAKFILENHESISNMTISALAKSAYCSPSSVSRFVNKLGFESYYDFCRELKHGSIETSYLSNLPAILLQIENQIEDIYNLLNKYSKVFIIADDNAKHYILDFVFENDNTKFFYLSDTVQNLKQISLAGNDDLIVILNTTNKSAHKDSTLFKFNASIIYIDLYKVMKPIEVQDEKYFSILSQANYDSNIQKLCLSHFLNLILKKTS